MSSTFAGLGLPADLVAALAREGITDPFPIQSLTIGDALAGRDICGKAKTGSGKTLAFGLPMLTRVTRSARSTPAAWCSYPPASSPRRSPPPWPRSAR
jgi:superfamily II DNA/RNA helicase